MHLLHFLNAIWRWWLSPESTKHLTIICIIEAIALCVYMLSKTEASEWDIVRLLIFLVVIRLGLWAYDRDKKDQE